MTDWWKKIAELYKNYEITGHADSHDDLMAKFAYNRRLNELIKFCYDQATIQRQAPYLPKKESTE